MRYVTITHCPNCKYQNIIISDKKLSNPVACPECHEEKDITVETLKVASSHDFNGLKKYFKRKPSQVLSDSHRTYDEITKELRPTNEHINISHPPFEPE
jgi:reverse gyrase